MLQETVITLDANTVATLLAGLCAAIAAVYVLCVIWRAGRAFDAHMKAIKPDERGFSPDGVQVLGLPFGGGLSAWAAYLIEKCATNTYAIVWAVTLLIGAALLLATFVAFVTRKR